MSTASPDDVFDRVRRTADRTMMWKFHCWYWGDAIAIDGLLEAAALGTGNYRSHVIETVERWLRHCPRNFDDVLAPGAAILRLVMEGQLPPQAGDRLMTALEGLPSAHGAIPVLEPHRPVFRFGFCIDAIYHLPALYALAGRWKGDQALVDRSIRIAVEGLSALRCAAGWAQWFDPTRGNNNQVAWSRGMGWAILGLLDLIAILDGHDVGEVSALAVTVMSRLTETQAADGNWSAVLDHPPAERETSTAAFYVAAALHPAARGLLSVPTDVLANAVQACQRALTQDGTFTGVTADVLPCWDITTYEHCPVEPSAWGQGAALRAFAALARSRADHDLHEIRGSRTDAVFQGRGNIGSA
jgi:rhamnogalacturonyl hydrolase YesR